MVVYLDKDIIVIEKTCPFCGKKYEGTFPSDEYGKWMCGGTDSERHAHSSCNFKRMADFRNLPRMSG